MGMSNRQRRKDDAYGVSVFGGEGGERGRRESVDISTSPAAW